ncbi:RNA 3'-terminal phosphate cyclase [Candidatus Micrarchaeota archaeon]|nr:RNA 3'-terminal phosphate cyclase [Candidatus Micrarchaeota archaeon]MBU1930161.1 RNA 3'-terminal phosphate cyclase [Candidatus Micrarchaeota archaeon]
MTEEKLNMVPIVVDASAGGQVFRTAIGLSALLQKPVEIRHIRQKRPRPGLQAQHLTALKTLQQICNSRVKGLFKESPEVVFFPQKPVSTRLVVNIGTAGSIGLLLQSVFFPSLVSENRLRVIGGTNVPFAPPIEFVQNVLLPELKAMNCRFEVALNCHGFFPKGKGRVSFVSKKTKLPLKSICFTELGTLESIECFSVCASLPREVAERQSKIAEKILQELSTDFVSHVSCKENSFSCGSSIVLLARFSTGRVLSASAIGKKGFPAEEVGKKAAYHLLKKIRAERAVDEHLADQLVPFMALAKGPSTIETAVLSEHTLNNIKVCEQLLGVKFEVSGEKNNSSEIFVEGMGFKEASK